jgi:hypothetical protein
MSRLGLVNWAQSKWRIKGIENFMAIHASLTLCTIALLFVGGVAFAQESGTTTGPAAGKNVEPSTATEKMYENDQQRRQGGPVGGGRPGVEAMPGTQGGAAPKSEK